MAITNTSQLKIHDTIRFRTLSTHDNVSWAGEIVSLCDYDTACRFEDVDTMYADIKRVKATMSAKENLIYLILLVQEDPTNVASVVRRVFALDWIDVSTLEYVDENTYQDIRIYDIDAIHIQEVLKAITAMGYIAEIRVE